MKGTIIPNRSCIDRTTAFKVIIEDRGRSNTAGKGNRELSCKQMIERL